MGDAGGAVGVLWRWRRAYSSVWAGCGADFPAPIGRDDGIGQGWGEFLGEGLEDQVEDVIVA